MAAKARYFEPCIFRLKMRAAIIPDVNPLSIDNFGKHPWQCSLKSKRIARRTASRH